MLGSSVTNNLEIGQQVILIAEIHGPIGISNVAKLTATRAQLANGCWVTLADFMAYGADRRMGREKLKRVELVTPELLATVQKYRDRVDAASRLAKAKGRIYDHLEFMRKGHFGALTDERVFAVEAALDGILHNYRRAGDEN
jgi:hypothetical protein